MDEGKTIRMILLDGPHKGESMEMSYKPVLRMPKPNNPMVSDEKDNILLECVEYKECFRAVDGEVVLYSQEGKSLDFIDLGKKIKKSK